MYGTEEIAMIVYLDNHRWFDRDVCRLVAKYCSRLPREALDFAKAMKQEYDLNGGDWESVAARVAKSLKIDRYGMTRRRLNALVALGQIGAVSKNHLADFAGCGIEELEKFVMPALLVATSEDPAMVAVTNKGYAITHRGLEELDKRGIPHRGAEVVTVGGQRLDFGSYDRDDFGGHRGRNAVAKPMLSAPSPEAPQPKPTTSSGCVDEMVRLLTRSQI
jgi:hypothetical protein